MGDDQVLLFDPVLLGHRWLPACCADPRCKASHASHPCGPFCPRKP
ncbi:hypothetical protein I553_8623 [Mycobacterium xenopi 4042]|uniref:Uncharacterized protein n=1 Tax=Mycobacterium xenopi 4042 TaxID=1299334 RepID=X8CMT8_MYCXE|nr:hypothetical protein I553_8623 [Mycobacterium xenopi 4042]